MGKRKFANIGFSIVELAMCTSKRTQRPLEDMMGSLSPFISTKMLVVIDMWIAFGLKLRLKEWSPLCHKIFLWRSVLVT